uniref:Uncharacterized protein n=1 Tax=Arundo donax TaxID=35708 RepID=A0A0A9G6B9_ARUDO
MMSPSPLMTLSWSRSRWCCPR